MHGRRSGRAGRAGFKLAVADHVWVWHAKSASFGRQRRDQLSKQGTARFVAKHPDVDLAALQRLIAEAPALAALRQALRQALRARLVTKAAAA